MKAILRFAKDESGATAIEYGLIAAGVTLAIVTMMVTLSDALTGLMTSIAGDLVVN